MGVRGVIDDCLRRGAPLTTKDVAERAGVSRQAAQKQLKALVASGTLRVEGKARAAKYFKSEHQPNLWAKVNQLAEALQGIVNPELPPGLRGDPCLPTTMMPSSYGRLTILAPQARLAREHRVEVATAGSLFRLSARLLLQDVDCDVLTLDFRGVEDLGDEFVEEIFERWAPAHPLTKLRIVNLQEALAHRVPAAVR